MLPRIMLYTDGTEGNGVAEYNHAVLCHLAASGFAIGCVQSPVDNPLVRRQAELGVQHVWLPYDTRRDFRRSVIDKAGARRLFESERPDLILFANGSPLSNFAAKSVAHETGIPYVVVEGFVAEYMARGRGNLGERMAAQYAGAREVVAVSRDNLDLLHRLFGLPADKGSVIYYGRPARFFRSASSETRLRLRAEWSIPREAVLCFTAGRLDPIKGYQYQLEAIRLLRQHPLWPRLFFAWAGSGQLSGRLAENLRRLGAAEHVKMLGQRWDIADWLDAVDIYVHPSEAEGMPLAIMEAMAKGIPVVASGVGGIPEELGDTGRVLPPPREDPPKFARLLADTIVAWADSALLRQQEGAACRLRALALFREERMLEELTPVLVRELAHQDEAINARQAP